MIPRTVITLFLILHRFTFPCLFAQTGRAPIANEGIIQFRLYIVGKADTFSYANKIRFLDTATYFVKGNKVFRKPYKDKLTLLGSQKDQMGNSTTFYQDLSSPGYLLDFDRKVAYIYNDSTNKIRVKALDSINGEALFHNSASQNANLVKIISIDTTNRFSGLAVKTDTKDTIAFICARDRSKMASPLNAFFNGLTYPVVKVCYGLKHTVTKQISGWAVYEITALQPKKIDEKYFFIDK